MLKANGLPETLPHPFLCPPHYCDEPARRAEQSPENRCPKADEKGSYPGPTARDDLTYIYHTPGEPSIAGESPFGDVVQWSMVLLLCRIISRSENRCPHSHLSPGSHELLSVGEGAVSRGGSGAVDGARVAGSRDVRDVVSSWSPGRRAGRCLALAAARAACPWPAGLCLMACLPSAQDASTTSPPHMAAWQTSRDR